jgi:hypothetical protein
MRAQKRDIAEPAIVEALQAIGAKVYRDLPVDLLVYYRGRFHCLEVKTPGLGAHRKERKRQLAFLADTASPIVKTPEEALQAVT